MTIWSFKIYIFSLSDCVLLHGTTTKSSQAKPSMVRLLQLLESTLERLCKEAIYTHRQEQLDELLSEWTICIYLWLKISEQTVKHEMTAVTSCFKPEMTTVTSLFKHQMTAVTSCFKHQIPAVTSCFEHETNSSH